jgi:hypothetical protein
MLAFFRIIGFQGSCSGGSLRPNVDVLQLIGYDKYKAPVPGWRGFIPCHTIAFQKAA